MLYDFGKVKMVFMLRENIIKKVLFSRYLYTLAEENIKVDNPVKLSAGIILLQDSVEVFLIALAECVSASLDANITFDKYIQKINEKISPKELPFKAKLIALNKLRVNSKHYAIQPPAEECRHFLISVSDFYEEVSLNYFGKPLGTISLIDLLDEGEVKDVLKEAEEFYENGKYDYCLINCRKALYLEFEQGYSIEKFKEKQDNPIFYAFGKSPYWAKDPKYIEENVRDPSDYIIYDHNAFEMELMQYGIEHNDFWNVWRLTPEVYRREKDKEWVVKYEFNKLDKSVIKANAEYCLDGAIDLILKMKRKRQAAKAPTRGKYYLELKSEEVKLFTKADKNSPLERLTPKGLTRVDCDFYIKGLNDDDNYWHVCHINDIEKNDFIIGYIHEDDVI